MSHSLLKSLKIEACVVGSTVIVEWLLTAPLWCNSLPYSSSVCSYQSSVWNCLLPGALPLLLHLAASHKCRSIVHSYWVHVALLPEHNSTRCSKSEHVACSFCDLLTDRVFCYHFSSWQLCLWDRYFLVQCFNLQWEGGGSTERRGRDTAALHCR